MIQPYFQHERATIYLGDNLDALRELPDNSCDTLITDPPAGISFMNAEWDRDKGGRDAWVAWLAGVLRECRRVLKPGAMTLVWALPRTSHWTGWALEEAGFEVIERIVHVFGGGFPKSHNISKAIDRHAGATREVLGEQPWYSAKMDAGHGFAGEYEGNRIRLPITAPATPEAQLWDGWGTRLKPAAEDWWLAMVPLERGSTYAANALKYGVAGLHVDGARVAAAAGDYDHPGTDGVEDNRSTVYGDYAHGNQSAPHTAGRWPPNLVLSHTLFCTENVCDQESCPIAILDRQSGDTKSTRSIRAKAGTSVGNGLTLNSYRMNVDSTGDFNDTGGASRFFPRFAYFPKASKREREGGLGDMPLFDQDAMPAQKVNDGRQTPIDNPYQRGETERKNTHSTVKPLALMEWLCRLTETPTGGVVLDPFLGSGTTGVAALRTGRRIIGMELSEEYASIARRRIEAQL